MRALSDPHTRLYFEPFLRGSQTVSEVALELNQSVNAVLMRVRRFVRLGLLEVVHQKARAGRPIKHYQVTTHGFFIPFSSTTFETPEAWLEAEFRSKDRALSQAVMRSGLEWGQKQGQPEFGKRLYLEGDGRMRSDFGFSPDVGARLLEPEAPALMQSFVTLNLPFEAAKRLQAELEALVKRYALEEAGGDGYALRVTLAPG